MELNHGHHLYDLYQINQHEMPSDIQSMIDSKEIGAAPFWR